MFGLEPKTLFLFVFSAFFFFKLNNFFKFQTPNFNPTVKKFHQKWKTQKPNQLKSKKKILSQTGQVQNFQF